MEFILNSAMSADEVDDVWKVLHTSDGKNTSIEQSPWFWYKNKLAIISVGLVLLSYKMFADI